MRRASAIALAACIVAGVGGAALVAGSGEQTDDAPVGTQPIARTKDYCRISPTDADIRDLAERGRRTGSAALTVGWTIRFFSQESAKRAQRNLTARRYVVRPFAPGSSEPILQATRSEPTTVAQLLTAYSKIVAITRRYDGQIVFAAHPPDTCRTTGRLKIG